MSTLSSICITLSRVISAGDSADFTVDDGNHPVGEGWTMMFAILSDTPVTVPATDDGEKFLVSLSTDVTGAIPPGVYATALIFSNTGKRETVTSQNLFILPDPTQPISPTWEMQTLTQVQAAIAKIGKTANAQVSINGETYTKQNLPNLLALFDRLTNLVKQQLKAMGRPSGAGPKKIVTRFF